MMLVPVGHRSILPLFDRQQQLKLDQDSLPKDQDFLYSESVLWILLCESPQFSLYSLSAWVKHSSAPMP